MCLIRLIVWRCLYVCTWLRQSYESVYTLVFWYITTVLYFIHVCNFINHLSIPITILLGSCSIWPVLISLQTSVFLFLLYFCVYFLTGHIDFHVLMFHISNSFLCEREMKMLLDNCPVNNSFSSLFLLIWKRVWPIFTMLKRRQSRG